MDHRISAATARLSLTDKLPVSDDGATQAKVLGAGDYVIAGPLMLGDDVPDDDSTNVYLAANQGQTVESQLDHPADQDFYAVELSAGESYEFILTPEDTDGTTGPDMLIELYDGEGNLIVSQDGGGFGADEQIDYTVATAGTYYINVKGYLDIAIGGYSLTAQINTDENPDPNLGTPLDAIDWGTRVDTDGVVSDEGREVIQVYFAKAGEVTPHPITPTNVATGFQDFEKEAVFTSFLQYENVINIDFVEVDSQEEADFILTTSPSAPVLLGAMSPPGESTEGVGWFNNVGVGWDEQGLQQGGYGFITFTHELGHGMGLAHPHDNGGNSVVMDGVESDTDSGAFGLNQGVHTVMTYNDGWPDGPYGKSPDNGYGWSGTLMAFDIAVLQQKYGANADFRSGSDTYVLSNANKSGTFYSCIWDTGGTDVIVANGNRDAVIDLRPATLEYEVGGGGWVSYNFGIHGGFTIANGVVIEDAKGGNGSDKLQGNDADNRLYGRAGGDLLIGGLGEDLLEGGDGNDTLAGGANMDIASYASASAAVKVSLANENPQHTGGAGKDRLNSIEGLIGSDFNDTLTGSASGNDIRGGDGDDLLSGGENNDRLTGQAGADTLLGGVGRDLLRGGAGDDLFVFGSLENVGVKGADRVLDLDDGDVIDLSGIDAQSTTVGDQAFEIVAAFSRQAGELMLTYDADKNRTFARMDVDGDGRADMTLVLFGDHQAFGGFVL